MTLDQIMLGIGVVSLGLLVITQRAIYNPLYILFLLFHSFRKLSLEEQMSIANCVLDYCRKYIGQTKNIPKVEFRKFKKEPLFQGTYGVYLPNNESIVINLRNVKNNYTLITTLIHEYIHHSQYSSFHKTDYHRLLNQGVSYVDHPWEKAARWHSRTFFYPSFIYVLSALNYFD